MLVERATEDDLAALYAIDPVVYQQRHAEIEAALRARHVIIAREGFDGVGYAIVDQTFFEQYFIRFVLVHADYRRRGVASALIGYSAKICPRDRIFTACAASNLAYVALCERLGFVGSGSIEQMRDDGEPILIFVKRWEMR
jgi:GNAT superfamily N-acetyltransferase